MTARGSYRINGHYTAIGGPPTTRVSNLCGQHS
jgi:hypothetical protein